MIEKLIDEKGKLMQFTSGEHLLILHFLARTGNSELLRALGIVNMLNDHRDDLGMNLLMWASRGGDEASISLAGEVCKGNTLDIWGGNALHHWAESLTEGLASGCQVLLSVGVDPSQRDLMGLMPIHWGRNQAVWAWFMGILWARGRGDAWKSCNELSCGMVAKLMENKEMIDWLECWVGKKNKLDGCLTDFVKSDKDIKIIVEKWDSFMTLRRLRLESQIDQQNCVARKLGLELL